MVHHTNRVLCLTRDSSGNNSTSSTQLLNTKKKNYLIWIHFGVYPEPYSVLKIIPVPWVMALGFPVVPDENNIQIG